MQIKLSVYASSEKIITVDNAIWKSMDEVEKLKYIYDNYLDSLIDNSVQSDYEVICEFTLNEFIKKINDEYEKAKKQSNKLVTIAIETSGGAYEISECAKGFTNGNLDDVYYSIEDIACDVQSLIEINGDVILGVRVD